MKCDKIGKNLLAYVDGDIPGKKRHAIQKHLKDCEGCSGRLKYLSKIWRVSFEHEKIELSPYFWSTLSSAIEEYENRQALSSSPVKLIPRYAFTLAAVVILLAGVFVGVYLGDFSDTQGIVASRQELKISTQEQFLNDIQLNSFDNLPQTSLGSIYVGLESNKKP